MPWTRRQVKFLFSSGSPLTPEQKNKMHRELHRDPALGHERKGSRAMKRRLTSSTGYDFRRHNPAKITIGE